ncbi:hypothetical protein CPC08DRAFT_713759 [Agrocybe pediades]|nr:hypothetical protein CPC08DRAFT_713759 [Agrocybe pediades]
MTLLSLYDLLPYSISHPPNGSEPMSLEEAIGPDAVRLCMDAISRQHPSSLASELANIIRTYGRSSGTSSSQSRSRSHGQGGSSANNSSACYPNYAASQGAYMHSPNRR